MTWFPMGPDFVFTARNGNYKRLTRRNELGRQGLAKCIAVDQTDPSTIYVVDRPSSGGTAAFRTEDGGKSWKCISDSLQQSDPLIDPHWIAINPSHPDTIYFATYGDQGLYISNDKGDTWGSKKPIPGKVRKLIVDPRTSATLATTHLIAAATNGVHFSNDAGDSWSKVVNGDVFSLAAHMPSSGTARFYAGVHRKGVYYANDPSGTWTNLNDQSIGLPQFIAGDGVNEEDNFHHILVDICKWNPSRAYVWLAKPKGPSNAGPYVTEGIYTTSSPLTSWAKVAVPETTLSSAITKDPNNLQDATPASMTDIEKGMRLSIDEGAQQENVLVEDTTATTIKAKFKKDHASGAKIKALAPHPAQGWYNYVFAVAPNSPGDGINDILFFGRIELLRSRNGGKTWHVEGSGFHADQHAFAFFPESPPAGTLPVVYIGCDGGIGRCSKWCDPAFDVAAKITDHGEGVVYKDTGAYENLNHSRQCSALYQYTSHSEISALSYIGCQDTGVNGGAKTFGWRGLADADAGAIAIAPGDDGVKVWGIWGAFGGFASFRVTLWTDKGDFAPPLAFVKLGSSSGSLVNGTSNYEISPDDYCLAGAYVRDPETTLSAAISSDANPQTATPASMTEIQVGSVLTVDEGAQQETVTVSATTSTTFTAVFTQDHAAGAKLWVNRTFATRIDKNGIATQISQNFGIMDAVTELPKVRVIMPHFTDPDYIVCATSDQRVWYTTTGSTATGSTIWAEVAANKPANIIIHAIAIAPNKETYVLLKQPVDADDSTGATVNTPLFKLSEGSWIPQVCSGHPAATNRLVYGKLVAHPKRNDTLFASHAARVYELVSSGGQWTWSDISNGLPGQWIYDLWVGYRSLTKEEQHVILRAGIPTRGIWENVLAYKDDEPSVYLYLRDNLLDQGLLSKSEEGMKDPYDPTRRVWHYQSADIKVDARQPGSGSVSAFYQTDPEGGSPPFSHVLFDQLKDNGQSLQSANYAWVHAKVHNRSYKRINNVNVWAIYCNAAAGVPALSKSASQGDNFGFWNQFKVTGEIVPQLPGDSPWKSVGAPVTLNGLDVYNPQVASWNWQIPTLATGDPGHYCMVVFVHSAGSPISETSYNVDHMTPRNRQIGQKNLHIGPPLSAGGGSSGGSGSGGGSGSAGPGGSSGPWSQMNEYVEFHNPEKEPRKADLVFDFSNLPPELATTLQFTQLNTALPVIDAMTGIRGTHKASGDEVIKPGGDPPWRVALCWLWNLLCGFINWILKLFKLKPWDCFCRPRVPMPKFEDTVYEAEPGAQVTVPDVRFDGQGSAAAFIRIKNIGTLEKGSRYSFEVQQLVGGRPVGGSTYTVAIEGDPELPPLHEFPFVMEGEDPADWARIEQEAKDQKYIPPWAEDIVREREAETEK